MKKILVFLSSIMISLSLIACGGTETTDSNSINIEEEMEFYEFQWPQSEIANLLPQPQSNIGNILWEGSYGFVIYVAETPKDKYDEYVSQCQERGFTIDYSKGDDYFYGDNEAGYQLSLRYDDNNVMFVRIDEPEDISSESVEDIIIDDNTSKNAEDTTELSEADTVEETEELVDGMRPEFKDAMDSYEAFFDEYCEFMKKYSESTDTLEMLTDYTEYLTKYADTMIKLDEIENGDMTDAELKYYTEVIGRINQKLGSVTVQ